MIFSRIASRIAAILFLLSVPANAEEPEECAECYTAQQAREDLNSLYATLQAEHGDLYSRRSKAAYDRKIAELIDRIDGPVRKPEFHLMLHEATAFGRVGHAKTEAAVHDALAYIVSGGAIVPLSVSYFDDAMVVDQWPDRGNDLPPGSRITKIGDMELAEFEDAARRIISADTDRLLRAQIELALPVYIHLLLGPVEELTVEFTGPDGEHGSHTIGALTYGEMRALQSERKVPQPRRDPSERTFSELDDGIFYLQPGPFSASDAERGESGDQYAIGGFSRFVDEAFEALKQSGARDLLIDLRGNSGGDASFSDLIIARLAREPYRFASRYEVRAGPLTKRKWAEWEGDAESLAGRIAAALARSEAGELVAVELPMTKPLERNAFRGRVWLLVDRHSYSNAAVVAAMMQDQGIATILGEETADLPTTYGAVESFDLPHSGANIIYPKAHMVRPSGSELLRGVVPDFPIAPNSVGSSKDVMLDTALEHIEQTRR